MWRRSDIRRVLSHGAMVIAVVNPMSLAVLKAPGSWGAEGADIACGEGQPLGVPLSSGGPYFGFLTCRFGFIRRRRRTVERWHIGLTVKRLRHIESEWFRIENDHVYKIFEM